MQKHKFLDSAARPSTIALTKILTGELAEDEGSIRAFLEDKVPADRLDYYTGIVIKYLPVLRKQMSNSQLSPASETTDAPVERVLPISGDVKPSRRSPTGVTYLGWTIDRAVKTPGTFYALNVGRNGAYSQTGFTSAEDAKTWVEEVGEPMTYEGYIDIENMREANKEALDMGIPVGVIQ